VRIRTPLGRFGNDLLSQEHARVVCIENAFMQRKERELNPQGTCDARPASNRFPSPIGWPFR